MAKFEIFQIPEFMQWRNLYQYIGRIQMRMSRWFYPRTGRKNLHWFCPGMTSPSYDEFQDLYIIVFYLNENENKINWFKGLCYATFDAGRCFNPSINMISKSTCCCGSLVFNAPFGWGTPCQVIYNNFSIKYLINLHMTLWLFLDAKSHF